MDLAAAQAELAARGFDYLTANRMTLMLNDGKNALEDAWEFPWLQATLTGAAPLIIPDLKYVLTVKTGVNEELLGLDVRQLAEGGIDLQQAGAPTCWYLTDDAGDAVTMRTWPVAETTLTVVYVRVSPELVAATDTPLIPARYHSLWIDHAVVNAYRDSDNYSAAQALQAGIGQEMQSLILRYETRNRQHSILNSQRMFSLDD